ncbi:MAG: DUF4190 domain-containing protein [Actinobacteria bacterium]|nr:DUF4190 domain-containing protein [Actinomycetota bacterium]
MNDPTTTPAAAPTVPRNGFGITALALALTGLVFSFVPLTGFLALILGALAVVFGLLGWGRARRGEATNRTMAVISTALGVLAAVVGIIGISITFSAVDKLGTDLQNIGHDPAAMADVTASACTVSNDYGTGFVHATVAVTNSTDKTQTYSATISVNDLAGTRIGEINTFVNSLASRQSVVLTGAQATGNAVSTAKPGPAACTVANVNRFAS